MNNIRKIVTLAMCIPVFLYSTETCSLISSTPYGYTGDVSGKRVYTKEEYVYECSTTTEKQGGCIKWDEKQVDYNISGLKNDVFYESENFQGSIGEIIATAQAYDKINGLWSGWKGLCMDGADDGNWDWMSDPYVLGGMVMGAVSGGMGMYASSVQTSANAMQTSVRTAKAVAKVAKIVKYSTCAVQAGIDTAQMMDEYASDEPCDPIDEICSESDKNTDSGNIFTLAEEDYNTLVTNNPDISKNILIIDGVGSGILTLKITSSSVDTTDMNSAEAKKAIQDAKELALKVKGVMSTIQLASCVSSGGGVSGGSGGAESMLSAKALAKMALSAINPLLGVAAELIDNIYSSMSSVIDTCNNEEDAKEKGSRHEATLKAVPLKMCHLVEIVENGDKLANTYQRRFRYCCYDNITTRIIVEQTKAQFAKDWQHCTDITLKELAVVSFKACDPASLDAAINGVSLSAYASLSERTSAYQFTNKCIDTREYIQVLLDKYGGDDMYIDSSDAERIINNMR